MVSRVPPAMSRGGHAPEPDDCAISRGTYAVRGFDASIGDEPARVSVIRGVGDYFRNVFRAAATIFEGLAVTKSWLFRRPMTIQYPDKIEKPVQEMLPATYRGILEVDLDLCTGCMLCSRTCPIGTITVNIEKNAETGNRDITRFDIDIGQCMYCGLCVEACKFDALCHTTEFEASVPTPEELVLCFVKKPQPAARHKPGQAPERRRPGTILCNIIPGYGKRQPSCRPGPGENRLFQRTNVIPDQEPIT